MSTPVISREGLLRLVGWAEKLQARDPAGGGASQAVRARASCPDGGADECGPTVAPDRVSRRHANRLISIRLSGRCRYQAQTPLAQRAPGELRVPDRCWPRQYFAAAGEIACARPMPTLSSRIVQSVSGDICGPRANHSVRPAADHPLRDEPAKTRRAALDTTDPAMSYCPTSSAPEPNPGTKGTIGMNARPNIIAQNLSAVPAVRGNER